MVIAVSIRRTAFLRCDPDLAAVGYVTVVRFPVEGSVSPHCGPKMGQGEKIVRTGPNFNPFVAESEHRALLIRSRRGFKMILSHHPRFRCGWPPARDMKVAHKYRLLWYSAQAVPLKTFVRLAPPQPFRMCRLLGPNHLKTFVNPLRTN